MFSEVMKVTPYSKAQRFRTYGSLGRAKVTARLAEAMASRHRIRGFMEIFIISPVETCPGNARKPILNF
jgi:hypothetical protein